MGWWLLLAWTAGAADCDPTEALARAEQLVLEARLDQARDALRDVEKTHACGPAVTAEQIGRAWLIEGAVETFAGDEGAARTAFSAAHRVAPDLWIPSLGDRLKGRYDGVAAEEVAEGGSLEAIGHPEGAWFGVDGTPTELPAEVGPGLHLVQAGRSAEDVRWGRVVLVPPGQRLTLRIDPFSMADEPATAPVGAVTEPEPEPGSSLGVFAHVAVGGSTALGDSLALNSGGQTLEEPAIKWVTPLEVGLTVRPGIGWVRGAVGGGPVLGGQLLYQGGDGAVGWPVAVYGHLSGGVSIDVFDVGVLSGMSLPGRLEERVLAAVALGELPLRLELRAGANLPTERRPEPAFGLLLGWDPSR